MIIAESKCGHQNATIVVLTSAQKRIRSNQFRRQCNLLLQISAPFHVPSSEHSTDRFLWTSSPCSNTLHSSKMLSDAGTLQPYLSNGKKTNQLKKTKERKEEKNAIIVLVMDCTNDKVLGCYLYFILLTLFHEHKLDVKY